MFQALLLSLWQLIFIDWYITFSISACGSTQDSNIKPQELCWFGSGLMQGMIWNNLISWSLYHIFKSLQKNFWWLFQVILEYHFFLFNKLFDIHSGGYFLYLWCYHWQQTDINDNVVDDGAITNYQPKTFNLWHYYRDHSQMCQSIIMPST